jgi:hypothetical protein
MAGPEASARSPRADRSEMVRMATLMLRSCRRA